MFYYIVEYRKISGFIQCFDNFKDAENKINILENNDKILELYKKDSYQIKQIKKITNYAKIR
jgi:hypothetical protein